MMTIVAVLLGLQVSAAGTVQLPPEVQAVVEAAAPGFRPAAVEPKARDGRRYLDVSGSDAAGRELELDLLQTPRGWTVVEIQRDLPWADVPAAVRAAAADRWKGPEPVRVIESRQAATGEIVYELFAPGRPSRPALEIMVENGAASVLAEEWPH